MGGKRQREVQPVVRPTAIVRGRTDLQVAVRRTREDERTFPETAVLSRFREFYLADQTSQCIGGFPGLKKMVFIIRLFF